MSNNLKKLVGIGIAVLALMGVVAPLVAATTTQSVGSDSATGQPTVVADTFPPAGAPINPPPPPIPQPPPPPQT